MRQRISLTEPPDAAGSRLTHDRILEAASELIAIEGFRGLSMRKVGDRLGCAAVSLYRYFTTKEELLTALADRFIAEIELPDPKLAWDVRIVNYLVEVIQLFRRHPELAEISARQHLNSVSAFRGVEMVVGALREAGLTSGQAVSAWYALTFFTAGFAQRRATEQADRDRDGSRARRIGALPRDEFEHFHEIAATCTGGLTDQDFEAALRVVLVGVSTMGREAR